MNDIEKTLKTLKSLDYKSPVRSRYVGKLTREDLVIFNEKIKEAVFLPDIHLHREDKRCHSLGLTILNYLYDEEEILEWYNKCLKHFFNDLSEVQTKIIKPGKVYRKVIGIKQLGIDLGFDELIDRKLFQQALQNYKQQMPYPKELIDSYLKAIGNREPLIEAIAKTREIFGENSRHTFVRIIDNDILPVIGKDGLREYIEDMIVCFKKKRKVNPDIPVNRYDFSFFMTGSTSKFLLDSIIDQEGISTDWVKAYLEAMLPEFIKVKSVKREKLYRLLEFDESQIQEWEAVYSKNTTKIINYRSHNVLEIIPEVLSKEETASIKNNIKQLTEQFKADRTVPRCKDFFTQAQASGISLIPKKNRTPRSIVMEIIEKEIEEIKEYCYQTRNECIDFKSDLWRYYWKRSSRIAFKNLDFSLVRSPQLKYELKVVLSRLILKEQMINGMNQLLSCCADLEELFEVKSFQDITSSNLQSLYHQLIFDRELKPEYVSKINRSFIKAFEILIKEVPSLELINQAQNIHFHNLKALSDKTEIIPDEVLAQINNHLDEVPEPVQLIFKLFMATGWRFGEVVNLRPEDFRKVEGYPDLIEVETTITKTASSRKKAGYTLHPCDFIPAGLYNQLRDYLDKTRDEREFYHIDSCFYVINNGRAASFSTQFFNNSVNRLIKKYNIRDKSGNLWHFSSRQTRKKVAITLIEEGVPLNVVQQKLTHQSPVTTQTYYTESEEIKLAQINEDYFREYVEAHFNSQVREKLSETELKQLYLNYEESLRLENGVCRRPLCPRLSESGCAGCSKICTGEIYLNNWEELLESVRKVKAELERLYKQNGIQPEVYTGFEEYQNLVQRVNNLKSVVYEITEKVRK